MNGLLPPAASLSGTRLAEEPMLPQLFSAPTEMSLLTYGHYDPLLVILSVLMAIFSSWMGLQIAGQASVNRAQRSIVLTTGSLALGSGVWAMHFIGMLAFDLCTRVDYDPVTTIVSLLPSIGASFVALSLIGRKRLGGWALLGGGVLVGAGIGAMHYTGMASMQMSLLLRYDPWMFALSIAVAVVLSTLALWVRFGLRSFSAGLNESRLLLVSATVMGMAIAGMHYTGLAAARFVGQVAPGAPGSSNSSFVALAIALITVALTICVMAANGLLRYRQVFCELSRSEAWMRALLTTTVDGVITIDTDGVIFEFNNAAERIFGWRRGDIVGRNIALLIAEHGRGDQDGLLHFLRTKEQAVAREEDEVIGRRKDGSEVPIRRALGRAQTAGQDLFVCFITDISERRAMEQALRASEQQFRSLIGNIPGISYRSLVDGAQAMVFISDAVERVTGYPALDFVGTPPHRRFGALLHEADRDRVAATVATALREQRPYLVEYRLLHADGSIRWLWENGTGVANDAGQQHWLDGVILDITERRAMEEALRLAAEAKQAAAARASFIANMSHEIRTPMNAILGFTDVLLDGSLSPEQRRHLDTVRSAGRSLLRLLNEVLDTAKLEKGAVELELTDFDLLGVIDELASTLGANARAKGLHVNIDYDPSLPTCLHGDELRIRQVLTNLLDNAIKFTAAGSVTLRAELQGDALRFLVRDTGIGIAADRLAAIFEPFTQADPSMTRRYGGTGLGTTISKQIVELMGGRIWVESTVGEGSCFYVTLPLVPARFAPRLTHAPTAPVLPPLRVLITDDVPQNRELLELLLNGRGHTTTSAANGSAAVELAASMAFDVILMDVQMPVLDGLEATRRIRAGALLAGRPRVPVVAMTASVLDAHRRASTHAGMDGFVSKPVDWFTLSHEIARVLGLGETAGQDRPSQPVRQVPDCHAAPSRRDVDSLRVARRGAALLASLRRGALDDAALAELCAALATHRAAALLAPVHAALADFDLTLAQRHLDAVLAMVGADSSREPTRESTQKSIQ